MSSILRRQATTRLRGDDLLQKAIGGGSQVIAAEFWESAGGQFYKAVAGTFSATGSLGLRTSKQLTGPVSATGVLGRKTSKGLAGTAGGLAGLLSTATLFTKALSGILGALLGTLGWKAARSLAGVMSPIGAVGRRIVPSTLGGVFGMSGGPNVKISVLLSGSMSFQRSFFVKPELSYGGNLSFSGALTATLLGSTGGLLQLLIQMEQELIVAYRILRRK